MTERKPVSLDKNIAAFPCSAIGASDDMIYQSGMTLRDWYAGMALTGAIGHAGWSYEEVAERAYGIADAMMKAREKND